MYRLLGADEREVLTRSQKFYPTSFHEKVSSSPLMDKFYEKAVSVSGVAKMINESDERITIVDIAGGRGRFKDAVEKVAKKEFNYVVVDLSKEQLGKGEESKVKEGKFRSIREVLHLHNKEERGEKLKVVGDMSSVPVGKADIAVLLNAPNVVLGFHSQFVDKYFSKYAKFLSKEYDGFFEKEVIERESKKVGESEEGKILKLSGALMACVDKLNILEATKLLKNNGVLVIGTFAQGTAAYPIGDMKGIPLRTIKAEKFKLDKKVLEHWSNYSRSALDDRNFFVAAFTKTGEVGNELIDECEKTFKDNFAELVKIKRFWEILDELERIEKEKKDAAGEIRKVAEKVIKK